MGDMDDTNLIDLNESIKEATPTALSNSFLFETFATGLNEDLENIDDVFRSPLRKPIGERESLGILSTSVIERGLVPATEDLLVNMKLNSPQSGDILNRAVLQPACSGLFAHNSSSKMSSLFGLSTFEFNSNSNLLNESFVNISEFRAKFLKYANPLDFELDAIRSRLFSLPVENAAKHPSNHQKAVSKRKCVSDSNIGVIQEEILGNEFDDSVFIEGNFIASRIADGSIPIDDEICNILEKTLPPESMEDCDVVGEGSTCDMKDTIFKTIDKMLPNAANLNLEDTSERQKTESNNNIKEIPSEKTVRPRRNSDSQISERSKSKEASDILHNLSQIINSDCRNARKKCEGQQLLNTLANIFSSVHSDVDDGKAKATDLSDSGHSSAEPEEPLLFNEAYEVLDLSRKESQSAEDNAVVLDLSMKKGRLSQSFSFPSQQVANESATMRPMIKTACSASELRKNRPIGGQFPTGPIETSLQTKLRAKKTDGREMVKKGPLKAFLPIINMTKTVESTKTPPKNVKTRAPIFGQKRTSTPIHEKLKQALQSSPVVAQARHYPTTPPVATAIIKRTFDCSISPIVRKNLTDIDVSSSSNSSVSATASVKRNNASASSIPALNRRHSATDLPKRNSLSVSSQLRRSYSTENDEKTTKNEPNLLTKMKGVTTSLRNRCVPQIGKTCTSSTGPSRPRAALNEVRQSTSLVGKLRRIHGFGKENQSR